ncbi:cellulase family glycosylhydrolase [Pelagicoccus sp. SDUM812003]|uniref:cellulase family glycosylhydrolase n=1 Tax=Pelagicoccus sp. SDUM812003 TaxID=3041267 RepID=UPI00280F54EC|nr:cellulase family glycosylhydrolase [Pelagicoccus sp. SDUM812003]MDQ8202193.1 cellulase family glycosylhydrolase [Pelagicoccus sp. SDUM812003]
MPTPTYGWNLGNTLEPPNGEGYWGPAASEAIIDAVADSGFNTIRLPVAWDSHADQSTFQIDPAWMARVKEVVDWCYARDFYVLLNIHWDDGWFERNITDTVDPTINAKMQSYWTQIATAFAGYDNHLLFAGANEPECHTPEEWATLRTYYNTFISAVRATGGNNTNRWLVVQGPNTNWEYSDQLITSMPEDSTPGRLALEIHHYTPFPFALMEEDAEWGNMSYFWGQDYHHPTRTDRNATFDEEDDVDAMFQLMADRFISQGYPVIVGEFAARKRTDQADLTGDDLKLHLASRTYFHKYVVDSANSHGLKPIYWDIHGLMFDWETGALVDQDNARALTGGAALPPPGGGGIIPNGVYKITARHSGKALEVAGLGKENGSNVQQWGYWWGESQRWVVRHLGNNEYSIIGAQSGKALDVSGWGTDNGTNVHAWTYGGGANQRWIISETSDGYYRLSPSHASDKCLDVNGVSSQDGANAHIWAFGWGANQQWKFEAP